MAILDLTPKMIFNWKNNPQNEFLIIKLPLKDVSFEFLGYMVQFFKLGQIFVLISINMLIKKMPLGEFHHTHLEL